MVFLEDHRATYDIGSIALIEMFSQVLESLEQEIQVLDEQANLRWAGEYFASDPRVIVPALYDLSTTEVTVMERVEGFRVTDAYLGDPVARTRLARRLLDITVFDVLVADGDTEAAESALMRVIDEWEAAPEVRTALVELGEVQATATATGTPTGDVMAAPATPDSAAAPSAPVPVPSPAEQ